MQLKSYYEGHNREKKVDVKNWDLLHPFAFYDCAENIVGLTISLLKALDGDTNFLDQLDIKPSTPFKEKGNEETLESVPIAEMEEWLKQLK